MAYPVRQHPPGPPAPSSARPRAQLGSNPPGLGWDQITYFTSKNAVRYNRCKGDSSKLFEGVFTGQLTVYAPQSHHSYAWTVARGRNPTRFVAVPMKPLAMACGLDTVSTFYQCRPAIRLQSRILLDIFSLIMETFRSVLVSY